MNECISDLLKIPFICDKKILLVSGKKSFPKFLKCPELCEVLGNLNLFHFHDYSSNPKKEEAIKGSEVFLKGDFNFLLAIGGGSAMDMAKLIKFFSNTKVPLVAIPTTCGTGSEATSFATYYEGKIKKSADSKSLLPNYTILYSQLLKSLPKVVKGHTLSDALSHAIESYWSINSTEYSRQLAREAISIILEKASFFMEGHNREALKASHLAGKAINLTKTTAAHALSYSMTSLFDIPHGQAVALSLPELFVFNANIDEMNCQDKRGHIFVQKRMKELMSFLKVGNPEEGKESLKRVFREFGLKNSLEELGIDIKPLIQYGPHPDRLKNNPRAFSSKDMESLLKKIQFKK